MNVAALPSIAEIRRAAAEVYAVMPATPQYAWPLLAERAGCDELWVKHENHTPLGAFKVRGGVSYFNRLHERGDVRGVVCATRGNHGRSIAFNARRTGLEATIVVPHGNSREQNAAMRSYGARVVEFGEDFQAALERAREIGGRESLHFVPSFDMALFCGVASYALEFFTAAPALDAVYVPVGLGSGLAATLAARDGLGLDTEVVAVVAGGAPAYALSIEVGRLISAPVSTFADGMACRTPNPEALAIFLTAGVRCVRVSDAQIAEAMRLYFSATHNVAEGAGAASLAAALADGPARRGRIGVVLSGGNIDRDRYARILSDHPAEPNSR
jgi:threonine dehydratase